MNLKKIFIIAEAGVNHNGSLLTAKKMIDVAVMSKSDAVKFQTFKAENMVSKFAKKALYQKRTTNPAQSQYEMLKMLEFNFKEYKRLFDYCRKKKIIFISSPFDLESIDLLNRLGVKMFKIPSGEITNLPYLRKIGGLKKKIIMSTGMANLKEIKSALDILISSGTKKSDMTVLHCNTEYPTPFEDVNLRAMLTIKDKFGVKVGYSDHSLGIEIPIAAASLGAQIIEKHFTLDKNMEGPDHKVSLDTGELKAMVKAIRNIEKALGDGVKKVSSSELKNIPMARKSIIAARDIKSGEIFTDKNISVKRPGLGINPMKWDEVIGKIAKKDFKEDELIEL